MKARLSRFCVASRLAAAAGLGTASGCGAGRLPSAHYPDVVFEGLEVTSDPIGLTPGACNMFLDMPPSFPRYSPEAIPHILKTGHWVTEQDILENYLGAGCAVVGVVTLQGRRLTFRFDLGGLITFEDGRELGCKQDCCIPDFAHCGWEEDTDSGDEGN